MSRHLIPRLFECTYQFIDEELLPLLNWMEVGGIFEGRRQARDNTVHAWIDVLPALANRACGGTCKESIPLAVAWALYVFAGRIHDDIQDGEGEESPWNTEGLQQSLPTALSVMGLGQMALARIRPSHAALDITDAFGRTLALAAQGQREQSKLSLDMLSIETYFSHLVARTAVAFATACWSGARLASAEPEILNALYEYGMGVGIAIQIEDDCMDLKKTDLSAGAYSLPVIYALSQSQDPHTVKLSSLLTDPERMLPSTIENVFEILTKLDAFQWSLRMAGIYRAKAIDALSVLPAEADTILLEDFALGKCTI